MDCRLSGHDQAVQARAGLGMATFIPERVGTTGARSIHLKRALTSLDDDYVVRTPLRQREWAPDLFVQHASAGWLVIMVSETPFAALTGDQLFENGDRDAFESTLLSFQQWRAKDESTQSIGKLVIMWACSPEEVQAIAGQYLVRLGIRLLSRKQFIELGAKLIPRLLTKIGEDSEQTLIQRYFPEAAIHPSCTTKRKYQRDNSAKLQRFFLDHQQEWASKLDIEPPEQTEVSGDFSIRLVNGVAGSGKTLIALSRALLLAELFPQQEVLVLIHNTPVVADIKANLMRTRGALPNNLEISTYFTWVHRQWRNVHQLPLNLVSGTEKVEDLIEHYRSRWPDLKYSGAQLREELDFINEALITDPDHYATANRAGRGFALRTKERAMVWELFCAVTAALDNDGQKLWSALPREVSQIPLTDRVQKYDHVLIDEAQFFAPSWFQTVKLGMADRASLFMCADPNQGFMKNRLSWRSVGLDVTGRTKKLRKSYRTTRAILSVASELLARNTQGDTENFLVPDMTGMEPGVPPMFIHTDSPQDSVDRLINEIQAAVASQTMALNDVLVIYGDKVSKKSLYDGLSKRLGEESIWWLNKDRKDPPHGVDRLYLRLANLDTATGLEAGAVFLIGVENLFIDASASGLDDDASWADREERFRKLYMAMTRAGWYLVLISCERLPEAIGKGFQELRDEESL